MSMLSCFLFSLFCKTNDRIISVVDISLVLGLDICELNKCLIVQVLLGVRKLNVFLYVTTVEVLH